MVMYDILVRHITILETMLKLQMRIPSTAIAYCGRKCIISSAPKQLHVPAGLKEHTPTIALWRLIPAFHCLILWDPLCV